MLIVRTITYVIPNPSFVNRLMALIIASMSGVAAAGALIVSGRRYIEYAGEAHPLAYMRARIGFAICLAIIGYSTAGTLLANATDWRVVGFAIGVTLAASGYIELAWRWFRASWEKRIRG